MAYYDKDTDKFYAIDYYMSHYSQCDGKQGVCPDERIGGRNDVEIIKGERKNGITTITYQRPLQTNEAINDKAIPTNDEVNVIAAFGMLNARKEANAHSMTDKTTNSIKINFSSRHDSECVGSLYELVDDDGPKHWKPIEIIGENTFTARIGPTGGTRGYTPITGNPSWGICWYVNDQLIPEIYVERGQSYTFMVEGGDDKTNPARYHPFYITSSPEGGFGQKSNNEQKQQTVYAGVDYDENGEPYPTAAGGYCEWKHKDIDRSAESDTFEKYKESLVLDCVDGAAPAVLNWTVANNTPSLVYYQVRRENDVIVDAIDQITNSQQQIEFKTYRLR